MFFLPESTLREHLREGRTIYETWRQKGFLTITEGSAVDLKDVENTVLEYHKKRRIEELVYDPWNSLATAQRLEDEGNIVCVQCRQGFASLSAPSKNLEALVLTKKIRHGGNPMLTWNAANAQVKIDENMNIRPIRYGVAVRPMSRTCGLTSFASFRKV